MVEPFLTVSAVIANIELMISHIYH